jgi:hypothetical protein
MSRYASTNVPLAGSAVWDSQTLEVGLGDRLTGSVFADQPGNIFIQQSSDFTNWDVATTYAIVANTGKGFSEEILLPFVRIHYVNGATPQTIFRLTARVTSAGPR